MRDRCELLVIVRSRKVVAAAREDRFLVPVAAGASPTIYLPMRSVHVIWAQRLDDDQRCALAEARRLGVELGMPVRVVDLGRTNALTRFLRLALLRSRSLPVLVFQGPCLWEALRDRAVLGAERGIRV